MRLALFPLDVVLFPGALLPLHIFEPRYQQLLVDCAAGDRRFGIVPTGTDGQPPTGVIGTVAQIRAAQAMGEGRSNIIVSGERRFMLRRYEDDPAPYFVGLADPFEDEGDDLDEANQHTVTLRQLADRCAAALGTLTTSPPSTAWAADAATLSFQIAAMLDTDLEFKQRFLGMRSAMHRVAVLLSLLPRVADDLEARAVVRERAKRNGSGGAHADVAQS
jgi:Lon protease-like protein